MEISPDLCTRCENKFKITHPELMEKNRIKIVNQDIANYSDKNHNFVLFFEVLDNMAHDKVIYDPLLKEYNKQALANLETN